MAKQKRRRQLLVDRQIQVGLSLRIVGCLAAYMLLFGCVSALGPLFTIATGQPGEGKVIVASERLSGLLSSYLVPALLTFTCLGLHCFVMLHRIAGPAYRFRMVLKDIRNGEISGRVRLRDGDFLTDVAESMDGTISSLRDDFDEMKREATALANQLDELPRGTEDPGSPASAARASSRKLVELLEKYRTTTEEKTAEGERAPEEAAEKLEELETPV